MFYHRIQDEGLRIDRTVTLGISYGWLNLTWEGFYDAENVGILSFSVMTQSLVNWPDRIGESRFKIEILRRDKA